jgi:hypothetical protein
MMMMVLVVHHINVYSNTDPLKLLTIIIPTTRTIQQVPYKNFNKQNTFQSSELIREVLSGKNRQNFNQFQY